MAPDAIAIAGAAEEGETDEDEAEEQPGQVRADQAAGGERRPRRRGRRGGRRRRGGPEDGLAGSIADELGPTSVPEATSAVADFDGYTPPEASPSIVQPESVAPHLRQSPNLPTTGRRKLTPPLLRKPLRKPSAPRGGAQRCAKK